MASAVGVRCVGLFGNLNEPNRWHPRGEQHCIIHRMAGLEQITVDEVADAVRDIVATPFPQPLRELADPMPLAPADCSMTEPLGLHQLPGNAAVSATTA